MSESISGVAMNLMTLFGGIAGGAIGFLVLAVIAAALALPYLAMNRTNVKDSESERTRKRGFDAVEPMRR